jgi:hypothetical protein
VTAAHAGCRCSAHAMPYLVCHAHYVLLPCTASQQQKADEEAAKVYEEFVESFKGDDGGPGRDGGGVKAFVRGGVVAPGSRSHEASGASCSAAVLACGTVESRGHYACSTGLCRFVLRWPENVGQHLACSLQLGDIGTWRHTRAGCMLPCS